MAASLEREGYGIVLECADVYGARRDVVAQMPDVALLDLDGTGVDADSVAALVLASDAPDRLPVLGFTADPTADGRARAARSGVSDFMIFPVGEDELQLRVGRALNLSRLQHLLRQSAPTAPADAGPSDRDAIRESLSVLAAIADYHDEDGDRHAQRVGVIAGAIAGAMDLPASYAEMLRDAAPLHDIGKVGIARRILLKPEKLTPSEWLHMMSHVDVGAEILGSARSHLFVLAAEIARTHHERWDGTGYTAGLRGEEIPISGRIVSVADVWDTLTHDRPYRQAWEAERALAEINAHSGTQFDPKVIAAFATIDLTDLWRPHVAQSAAY
jgi:putative two-component system response regulator